MAIKYDCVNCRKQITATKNNRYRTHTTAEGNPCETSSELIPEHILALPVGAGDDPTVPREGVDYAVCVQCGRKVKLTRLGYFEEHDQTLRGGDRCPTSGVRAKHAKKTEDVLLPGDEPASATPAVRDSMNPVANRGLAIESGMPEPARTNLERQPMESAPSADSGASTESSSLESPTTFPQGEAGEPDFLLLETAHQMLMGTVLSTGTPGTSSEPSIPSTPGPSGFPSPETGFDEILFAKQGKKYPERPKGPVIPMEGRALEVAARLKETFYAYTNRNSSDNRSAQRTIGPSEAGTPCDRQLAMKLLNIEPVNPQEGWAPFVGTAVHAELANMFEWANGSGSGRYVTEMSVSLGSEHVPRGTLDLLDRVLYVISDHKLMGRYTLDKLRKEGPSETYRKQIQIYGLGAELAGERVEEVAIIGWPRQESSLDKLYVYVEKYDRRVAEEAIDRVARIAQEVKARQGPGTPRESMSVARQFEMADDCRWCPFNLPGDKEGVRGCPGK